MPHVLDSLTEEEPAPVQSVPAPTPGKTSALSRLGRQASSTHIGLPSASGSHGHTTDASGRPISPFIEEEKTLSAVTPASMAMVETAATTVTSPASRRKTIVIEEDEEEELKQGIGALATTTDKRRGSFIPPSSRKSSVLERRRSEAPIAEGDGAGGSSQDQETTVPMATSGAPIVNPKVKIEPNWEVLEIARERIRNPNFERRAMVGAYDPFPLLWPNAQRVAAERQSHGRPDEDDWTRARVGRFDNGKEYNLGPGSYSANPRDIPVYNLGNVAFKSLVPRFPKNTNGTAQMDHIGPGTYIAFEETRGSGAAVSRRGFTPWCNMMQTRLGRSLENVEKVPIDTEMRLIERFGVINVPSFQGSRRKGGKWDKPTGSETSSKPTKSTTIHPFSKCYLITPPGQGVASEGQSPALSDAGVMGASTGITATS
ncbi:hypothetical protein HDU76_000792 [Blyttiomyces sp. JEL0837]|nr:hypothetical protein HDU76_000792 [Blyttiomyces sp. JEL0837]